MKLFHPFLCEVWGKNRKGEKAPWSSRLKHQHPGREAGQPPPRSRSASGHTLRSPPRPDLCTDGGHRSESRDGTQHQVCPHHTAVWGLRGDAPPEPQEAPRALGCPRGATLRPGWAWERAAGSEGVPATKGPQTIGGTPPPDLEGQSGPPATEPGLPSSHKKEQGNEASEKGAGGGKREDAGGRLGLSTPPSDPWMQSNVSGFWPEVRGWQELS